MNLKMFVVALLGLVSLIWSPFESEGQEIESLMKMGPLKQHQAFEASLFLQLSDQTDLLSAANVKNKERRGEKPPLNVRRIGSELLVGECLLLLGAIAGVEISNRWLADIRWVNELPVNEPTVFVGAVAGALLGSTIGVYIPGTIGDESGSFLATLGGSMLGMGLGLFIMSHATKLEGIEVKNDMWGVILAALAPPIGATIGFNLTRRYKSSPASETAFINFSDGQMSLAIPTITFRPDPYDGNHLTQSVDLVKVRF